MIKGGKWWCNICYFDCCSESLVFENDFRAIIKSKYVTQSTVIELTYEILVAG